VEVAKSIKEKKRGDKRRNLPKHLSPTPEWVQTARDPDDRRSAIAMDATVSFCHLVLLFQCT